MLSLTLETFLALLGEFPSKSPLAMEIVKTWDFPRYKRLLVEYATERDERVRAFLLEPKGDDVRGSGVLSIHQDGENRPYAVGKSEPAGVAGDPKLQYGLELFARARGALSGSSSLSGAYTVGQGSLSCKEPWIT